MAGGYREPKNPAPVSGPGALSKRTDGGQAAQYVTDLPYGQGQEHMDVQRSAPMSGQTPGTSGGDMFPLAQMSPSLYDGTDSPEEPVTAGMPFGAGPGPEALGNGMSPGPTSGRLLSALPQLLAAAESPYVSPEFRTLVNYVRTTLGG